MSSSVQVWDPDGDLTLIFSVAAPPAATEVLEEPPGVDLNTGPTPANEDEEDAGDTFR